MKQFAKLLAASIMLASSAGCSDNLSSLLTGELRTSLDSAVSRGRVALGRDSSAAHHDTGSDTSGVRHSGDTTEVRHGGDTTEVRHGGGLSDSTEVHHTGDVGDTTHISQHDGGIDSTRHGGSSGGGSNGGGSRGGGGSSDSTSHGGGHGESGGHH